MLTGCAVRWLKCKAELDETVVDSSRSCLQTKEFHYGKVSKWSGVWQGTPQEFQLSDLGQRLHVSALKQNPDHQKWAVHP